MIIKNNNEKYYKRSYYIDHRIYNFNECNSLLNKKVLWMDDEIIFISLNGCFYRLFKPVQP